MRKILKGKQVIGVCNFAEKNIAGVVSQVLILGSIDKEGKVILVHPSQKSENGLPNRLINASRNFIYNLIRNCSCIHSRAK
jgi:tRNA-binding EMAP/Myf-like protein